MRFFECLKFTRIFLRLGNTYGVGMIYHNVLYFKKMIYWLMFDKIRFFWELGMTVSCLSLHVAKKNCTFSEVKDEHYSAVKFKILTSFVYCVRPP